MNQELRLAKARRLLDRLSTNPFYGPLVASSGLDSSSLQSLDQWRELPVVDKAAMLADQEAEPPYGHRLGVDRSRVRQTHLTSGTSGFGQEAFALTEEDITTSGSTWRQPFATMGLVPGDLVATFYPVTFLAYGLSIMEAARVTGVQVTSFAGVDRSLALALLQRLQPAAIGTRPALLSLLARDLEVAGLTPREALPNLKGIVASGVAPISHVPELEELWRATIHEVYGSSQAGGIIAATGAPGCAPNGKPGVLEIIDDQFIVEFVDPETLEPVEEGVAEVILTCLDRVASPVARFRTRDRVEVVPAGDGLSLPGILAGSIGRFDDMRKVRGNNVWPGQLDGSVLSFPGVADYLCHIERDARAVDVMRIKILPGPDLLSEGAVDEIRRRVKIATNVTSVIEIVASLPPQTLKPKRLIDLREGVV